MNRKVLLLAGAAALAGMLALSAPASATVDDPIYENHIVMVLMNDAANFGHAIEMLPPSADGLIVKYREFSDMAVLDGFEADLVKFVLATGLDVVAPMALPIDRFAGLSPGDGDEPASPSLVQMLKNAADFGSTSRRYDPGWRVS